MRRDIVITCDHGFEYGTPSIVTRIRKKETGWSPLQRRSAVTEATVVPEQDWVGAGWFFDVRGPGTTDKHQQFEIVCPSITNHRRCRKNVRVAAPDLEALCNELTRAAGYTIDLTQTPTQRTKDLATYASKVGSFDDSAIVVPLHRFREALRYLQSHPNSHRGEARQLDSLDPQTSPSRDAAHFRRIVGARTEAELRAAVAAARAAGDSWNVIAAALDTTRQAAYERFGADHDRLS